MVIVVVLVVMVVLVVLIVLVSLVVLVVLVVMAVPCGLHAHGEASTDSEGYKALLVCFAVYKLSCVSLMPRKIEKRSWAQACVA